MGGFSGQLWDHLESRLCETTVRGAQTGEEVIRMLQSEPVSLLVLEHRLAAPAALDVLITVRSRVEWKDLPVIYCLNEGAGAELVKRLIREFDVQEVMLPPLDQDELAWHAGNLLGQPVSVDSAAGNRPANEALLQVQTAFLRTARERVHVLEQAGTALLERTLGSELRRSAEREAHKLAGLLGTIGLPAGSRYAAEAEGLLRGSARLDEADAMRFSELAVALRLELEKAIGIERRKGRQARPFSLLLVDDDDELAERLEAEANIRRWEWETARDLSEARRRLETSPPSAILLNPHVSAHEEDGMHFLEEASGRSPSIPVIVLTSQGTFTDRVEVARRGGRGFLSKSATPEKLAEAASQLLDRLQKAHIRIMAVDDDPALLDFLRSLLEPKGVSIATLDDPFRFWELLEAFSPDLLLLDVDLPRLSGVELCRVVRNDPRWAETPVVFLTRYNDAETIDRVFKSGADDFVSKPIVGPELLTRVFNRLDQVRLRKSIEEMDVPTGVGNRVKTARAISDFLDLARRHSQPLAFGLVRIDRLKEINREHGRASGDAVLQRMGALMTEFFRSADAFGRWDGQEFATGMYGLSRYDGVQRLAELAEGLARERFIDSGGAEFHVSLSGGVAEYDEDGHDLEGLAEAAESALVEARNAGGGKVLPAGWGHANQDLARQCDVALVLKDGARASLLTHSLESRGCRVRWLDDGKTAAKLLGGSRPALQAKVILLDAEVPALDGLSLLKCLASDGVLSKTRAIFFTSPSIENECQSALECGAFDCVVKPSSSPVVMQHIRRALEAHE
jgi:diguanylate cyclase (GGDEF)-like protein